MNILYVSGMPQPIYALLRGETKIKGLPAFYYPWKMLVERGHNVDFVLLSNYNETPNIKVDWFSENDIIKNIYAPRKEPGPFRIFRKIYRFFQLLYFTNKAVRKKRYDFIYCMAFEGVAGQIIANIYNIPHGVRSFGDRIYLEIKKHGKIKTAFKNPLEFLCYQLDCSFFLMTKDHKDQIITYNSWKRKKFKCPFYLWPHGVEFKNINKLKCDIPIPKEPYIYFPARIDPFKRQDRIIEVLNYLHKENIKIPLYFSGSLYSETYKKKLLSMIKEYNLSEYVHFLDPISQDSVRVLAHNALCNIIMIDTGAMNNVFCEIFSVGSVIITIDDGYIDEFITDGESGFLIKNESEAAEKVKILLGNSELQQFIKYNAKEAAMKKIMSIEERFGKEVELIENTVRESK